MDPPRRTEIERCQRTVGEKIDEDDPDTFAEAQTAVAEIMCHYNHERLHSALQFLRPIDYYRGNPLVRRRWAGQASPGIGHGQGITEAGKP